MVQSSPSTVHSQSIDKQRIVVIGESCTRITGMILHVLEKSGRRFDFSTPAGEKLSDAAIVIIEPAKGSNSLAEYHHHVLIISQLQPGSKASVLALANATPKSGTIIYDEVDPTAREIAKVERVDVTSNPYAPAPHELQGGKIVLVSSTHDKFLTALSSKDDLKNVSAAKELLKKIGISSGQFYRSIASFE